MAFKYNPSDASSAWPKGDYQASLMTCKEKTSRAGNDMYELVIECYSGSKKTQVWDYIVNPSTLFKLKGLARAIGVLDQFEAGTFDPMQHTGASFVVTLDIEEDEYGEKNKVKKYLSKNTEPRQPELVSTAAGVDPDIPF